MANQTASGEPPDSLQYSEKLVNGTRQRFSGPSHGRQWGERTFRMLATPPSVLRFFRAKEGVGMPQRMSTSSRPSGPIRTTGAIWSGKMAGREARLPVLSTSMTASSRISACPLVIE